MVDVGLEGKHRCRKNLKQQFVQTVTKVIGPRLGARYQAEMELVGDLLFHLLTTGLGTFERQPLSSLLRRVQSHTAGIRRGGGGQCDVLIVLCAMLQDKPRWARSTVTSYKWTAIPVSRCPCWYAPNPHTLSPRELCCFSSVRMLTGWPTAEAGAGVSEPRYALSVRAGKQKGPDTLVRRVGTARGAPGPAGSAWAPDRRRGEQSEPASVLLLR